MATPEEANEFLGGLAAHVDDALSRAAPTMTFSLVFWVKGDPEDAKGIAIMTPPDHQSEQRAVMLRAASVSKLPGDVEQHGLDTVDRVCFYEQDFYVLSNFSAFAIRWRGRIFPTVEHAYHFEKFHGGGRHDPIVPGAENPLQHLAKNAAHDIGRCLSAHDAFKLAQERKAYRRPDWDEVKVGVMQLLLFAKCAQHEYVRRKLLATGDRELVENSWRDDFWGWGPNRDGQNMLGRLWMATRAELRRAA